MILIYFNFSILCSRWLHPWTLWLECSFYDPIKHLCEGLGLWYFSYIVAVNFIGGGNRSTQRNHRTAQVTDNIMLYRVHLAMSRIQNHYYDQGSHANREKSGNSVYTFHGREKSFNFTEIRGKIRNFIAGQGSFVVPNLFGY